MNRDDSAEIVFLTGTLAVAAERSLAGRLAASRLRPAQFRLLFAIHLAARRRLESLGGPGLADEEARAVPLADVMRILGGLRPSSLSSALGGLPDGVVLQKAHKSDGRCKSLELSGKGELLAEEAIRHAADAAEELAAGLPADSRTSLLRLLRSCASEAFPEGSGEGA